MFYNNFQNRHIDTRSVVFNLIAINVLLFAATYFLPGLVRQMPDLRQVLGLYYPTSEYFKPIQLISHMFMHDGFMHIFFNMFNLYMFGTILERVWGPQRFLYYYLITGFGAVALHLGVQAWEVYRICGTVMPNYGMVMSELQVEELSRIINVPTIGASGAVFGLLTAYGVLFANSEIYIYGVFPLKAKYFTLGLIGFELWRGFQANPSDNVAHFAHLGGALIGYLLVKFWNKNRDFLY